MAPASPGYHLYGDPFRSSWPFQAPLPRTTEPPRYTFELTDRPLPPSDAEPIFVSEAHLENGRPDLLIHSLGNGHLLTFPDKFEFLVTQKRITAHLLGSSMEELLELTFLGIVSAFRLEMRGTSALHASAVAIGGFAVAFLGAGGAGKTTVATHLSRHGAPLLTDDLLAVGMAGEHGSIAYPGYAELRIWPEDARRSGLDPESLRLVHPQVSKRRVSPETLGMEDLVTEPCPIERIVVLDRASEGEPGSIRPLHPRQALLELVRHSFLPRIMHSPAFREPRFRALADLASRVPFRHLRYPAGEVGLEDVRKMIRNDLDH